MQAISLTVPFGLMTFSGEDLLFYLSVVLMSGLKFMVGVAMSLAKGLSFWEQFLCTTGGGLLGTAFFTYLGDRVRLWLRRGKPPRSIPERWARLWSRYGLWGIALLTPPILSPPIGTAIALAFGTPRHLALQRIAIAMIGWGLLFATMGQGLQSLIRLLS